MSNQNVVYVKQAKKKMEFAQRMVLTAFMFSVVIVFITLAANFWLLYTSREPMTQETVAAITTYGGITSGLSFSAYSALSAVRHWSLNKHRKGEISDEQEQINNRDGE